MHTILHMAISLDGFIAKADGNSDWVSKIDCDLFAERCREIGCVVVGRRTFEQFKGSVYPLPGITTIVLTRDQQVQSEYPDVFFAHSPHQAIEYAQKQQNNKILIAGGGHTNGSFLNEDLIDELFVSVHPLILGGGIKLFEGVSQERQFTLIETRELGEGLVELHYKK